jgi:serine/threonine protein kinase
MSQDSKYQKQRWIGSSERVDVYLGLNVAFGRKVAIKELRGGIDTSINERNSFFSEYDKWAKFEHPRLARIEDLDKTRAWVIQEYLPQSIADVAPAWSNNAAAAYNALEQILEGLAFLHQSGFIHFNLKSSNVRSSGEFYKVCDGRCVPIGFPGSLPKPRGSNRYLAPEMINEEFGSVGTATDIYVAGMIMLESLAGAQFESLFKGYVLGTPDTEIGWVRWHNSPETLDPIHKTLPFVPQPLATLIEGMICKQTSVRYAAVDRLLTDLRSQKEAILHAKPAGGVMPRPVAANEPVAAAPAPPAPGTVPRPPANTTSAPPDNRVKLIDRPASPTYIRCLSGTLAGTLFPTIMGDIVIGEGAHCNVRISPDHCPLIAGREVKIWLGNNGWQISDSLNHPLVVDSKTSFQPTSLRSGSIFRLSPRGPDFQFVVQGQHESTWQDIAAELELDEPAANVPKRLLERKKVRTSGSAAPPTAIPVKPGTAPAPPPQPASPIPPRAAAIAAPAPPAPPRTPASAAPPRPPSAAPGAPAPAHAEPVAKTPMDKNKRNNLILAISLPVVALLIILLVPQSQPANKKDDDKSQNNTQAAQKVENGNAAESATEPPQGRSEPNPASNNGNQPTGSGSNDSPAATNEEETSSDGG